MEVRIDTCLERVTHEGLTGWMTRLYCYSVEADDDSVQSANYAREIVEQVTSVNDGVPEHLRIIGEEPPQESETHTAPLFRVTLEVVATHRHSVSQVADFHRLPGCPNDIAEGAMVIYREIKRSLRRSRKEVR